MRVLSYNKHTVEQSARKHYKNKSKLTSRIGLFFAALVIMSSGLSGIVHAAPGDYVWQEAGTGVAGIERGYFSMTSSADGSKLAVVDNSNGSGGYIYTSADSGATWTKQTGSGVRNWWSIAGSSDGTKLAATVMGGYAYTSTDSGVTWTERTAVGAGTWSSIVSSADGTKLAVVDSISGIYTSTDSGATWVARPSAPTSIFGLTSSADGTKLAATSDYVYTSTDSGATWTKQTGSGFSNWGPIASSADGSKLYLAQDFTFGYFYTSTDSGITWQPVTSAGYGMWLHITTSADGIRAVATSGSRLYTSADSGATWAEQVTGAPMFSDAFSSITSSVDGTKLAASMNNGSIYLATLQGAATASVPFSTLTSGSNVAPSTAVSGATLSATSMTCYSLNNASVKTLGIAGVTAPVGFNLLGGIAYDLTCTKAGGSADVTLALNAHYTDLSMLRVYKQDAVTKKLTDVTSQVTLANKVVGNQTVTAVTYTITDGANFDEDKAVNSTIVDPLYIGEVQVAAAATTETATTLASTGVNIWYIITAGVALLITATVITIRCVAIGKKSQH